MPAMVCLGAGMNASVSNRLERSSELFNSDASGKLLSPLIFTRPVSAATCNVFA